MRREPMGEPVTEEILDLPEPGMRSESMLLNLGPQHPATHGVLRLICELDGETVLKVTPDIGFLHSSFEKLGEYRTWNQIVPLTDRMDYLAAINMNLGWSLTVEKLMKLQLPEKGRHLRVIVSELSRIASHFVGMGAYGLDLGTFSPFLYAFREREKILDLFEAVCGARLTNSYLTVGGATHDLPHGWTKKCRAFIDQLLPVIVECHTLLTTNAIFVRRTTGIGVLTAEMAIDYGCTGPVLRGSGVDQDLRRDGEEFYTQMYEGYAFEVICQRDGHYPRDHDYPPVPRSAVLGDCWHRFYVRMLEVMQAMDLVRQGIDFYEKSSGSFGEPIKIFQRLPKGETYLETEAPRGQMGFYLVSDGTAIPWRARARSSSFCNLSVCPELCRGCLIADIPAIVGSLDIVMGEIDR